MAEFSAEHRCAEVTGHRFEATTFKQQIFAHIELFTCRLEVRLALVHPHVIDVVVLREFRRLLRISRPLSSDGRIKNEVMR